MFSQKLSTLPAKLIIFVILLFVIGETSAEEKPNNDEWQFLGEFYLWGADIESDTTSGSSMDIPFHDIINNLEMVLMGTIGAQKGKLKLFTDFLYKDLEDTEKGAFNLPIGEHHQLTIGDKLETGLKAWVVQPMAAYTVYETPKSSIDLAIGARYIWIKMDLELRTTGLFANKKVKTSESDHNWDAIVGVKGKMDLSDKWQATLYLDGGSGDSDYTLQGLAGLNYKFDSFTGLLGYRYLKWKFNGHGALEDLKVSGPYVGGRFTF